MADERIPMLRETGIDAVLIGVPADTAGLACVDLDFAAAGELCVEHLAGLGHREVAFIGEAPAVYQRRSGFRGADAARCGRARGGARPGWYTGRARAPRRPGRSPRSCRTGRAPRVCGAERGDHLAAAQRAADGRADGARGHVRGGHLPGRGGRADGTAPDFGGHPGRGHGSPGGRDAHPRLADGAASEVALLPPGLTVRGSTGRVPAS